MGIIEVEEVTFRYRNNGGVEGVTFQVQRGELLGVIGPNSSGKTTLLRLLSKVLTPQAGRVLVEGSDLATISRLALACRLAVVSQEFQLTFPFTVAEVVMMGRYPHNGGHGWGTARDRQIVEAAMATTGVIGLADRRLDELSGGERQLVSLSRALAQEPSFLLLDEPTAHLDLRHQLVVMEILHRHRSQRQGTTLLISHDLNFAAEHCDRLLLLDRGHLRALGSPEEVVTQQHLEAVYGCPVTVERHPTTGRPRVNGTIRVGLKTTA